MSAGPREAGRAARRLGLMRPRVLPQLPGYELLERIGRGAHATINLAIEKSTRRKVAIKHILRRNTGDDKFIAQAETEFAVAQACDHPALRKCYDLVRIRKWLKVAELFVVMEYIEGDTLEHQCPDRLDEILRLFMRVAEGLHAMHLAGYAHADIKPNNIMLTAGGEVKLIDFGQSCPLGHRKERIQGTPDYIAPEQVARQKIDQRTDVFNLGATMYWVLTGKAFKTMLLSARAGDRMIEIESRRGSAPPHEVNPLVPLPLSKLISECCETSPERRPRDMRDVVARLDTILHLLDKNDKGGLRTGPTQRRGAARL